MVATRSPAESSSRPGLILALSLKCECSYYGSAIRENHSSVQNMRQAIWAIFLHKLSTDEYPQHGFCPIGEDSWCGFKKAEASGQLETVNNSTSTPASTVKTSVVLLATERKAAVNYIKACCVFCGMESTGAHSCAICKIQVHAICGNAVEEGYGSKKFYAIYAKKKRTLNIKEKMLQNT
ncbi:uncharacterized protein TNCV_3404801 [Trichonephila clavipes]|nr:uncharacterized protein TNCV_3404801 [Trichonephila clavipes]